MIKTINKQVATDMGSGQTKPHPAILFTGWSWIILLFILVMVNAVQANYWAGDDVSWMNFVTRGMKTIWSEPSPYGHYRPFFGTWLWGFKILGIYQPIPLTIAGIMVVLLSLFFAYRLFGYWLEKNSAFLAAIILTIHPLREPHLFWLSAQIDSWCLALSLACLYFALKFRNDSSGFFSAAILIPLLTLSACMCKEIALLLPVLIFVLPGKPSFFRKASAAVCSAVGALLYTGGTFMLFPRKESIVFLLRGFNLKKLINYPHQLFWPTDLSGLVMKARLDSEYFGLLFLFIIILLVTIFLAWSCLRFYKEQWVLSGIILLLAGAAVCSFDSDHRGLGLGCAGMSIILAGAITHWQSRKSVAISITAITLIAAAWIPCWLPFHYAWVDAKIFSRILTEDVLDARKKIGQPRFLVALGTPLNIKGSVWPSYVEELDECSISLLQVKSAEGMGKLQAEKIQNGRYRLKTAYRNPFANVSPAYEGSGVVVGSMSKGKYIFSLDYDPLRFNWYHSDCSRVPYFMYWNGKNLIPLITD